LITEKQIREALSKVMDPELNRSIVELGMVRDVQIKDSQVEITLALTTLACPLKDQIATEAKSAVLALDGVEQVEVKLVEMTAEEKKRIGIGQPGQQGMAEGLNRIQRVVAVMSGKGGVGKSLVAGLLGVALRRKEFRVGILDADITGPSIPKMFGLKDRPGSSPLGIIPVSSKTGIKVMSINLLLPREDEAVIWRGPLISSAIKQFWGDVFWGDLDWLVVDLPPGTSDAALTVMQSLPLSGVLLVTSPQNLAEMVVRKAARMAQALQIPLLGLVENMSYFVCPDTGKRYDIFGASRAEQMAAQMGMPFLGRLPIDPRISELCDAGNIEEYPAEAFISVAEQVVETAPEARKPSVQPK